MELEKLNQIKTDIDLLKNGIDPQSKIKITQDTILLSRYNKSLLSDISYVISSLIVDQKKIKKEKKLSFFLTKEEKVLIDISEEPISISAFTYKLNEKVNPLIMKKIKATEITLWLSTQGYLNKTENDSDVSYMKNTPLGESIGIFKAFKVSKTGNTYDVNLYNCEAQKFIIDNLEQITGNDREQLYF